MSELFNSKGELNAYDTRSALAQIAKIAATLSENTPASAGLTPQAGMSDARRDELIARAMQDPASKVVLAQSMANPIR